MIFIILAVTLSLSPPPGQINYQQETDTEFSLFCSSCGDSYIRAVFFKEGKTSYFGYTKDNSGNWINSTTDKTLYYLVNKSDLTAGSMSGKIFFKPDYESKHFEGAGDYLFKIGRYTSADSSALWSDSYPVSLLGPTPTITPSPTSTQTPTRPVPTNTPKPPTSTPKPPTPTTYTTIPPPSPRVLSSSTSASPTILIVSPTISPIPSITPEPPVAVSNPPRLFPVILIIPGLILVGYALFRL